MRKVLLSIVFCGITFGSSIFSPTANRVTTGSGAPSGSGCATSADVGKVYINNSAAAANSSFYSCDNTGVATYAWELSGGGGGAPAFSAITAGTNTAALVIGTGGSLGVSGTGTINATSLGGSAANTFAPLASPGLTGTPTAPTASQNDNSTKLATTAYTDLAVANGIAGVDPAIAVLAASTANVTGTYSNGVAGVGATFTVTATGAFTLDGISIGTIGQRVLLKDQSTGFQNGIYFATVVGSIGVSPIFTRALDYNTPSNINSTGAIPVQSGTVNTTTSWLLTSTVTTVGTDALTYTRFSYNPTTLLTTSSTVFNSVTYPSSFTSGGIPYASGTTTIASSSSGTAKQIILWGGAGNAPTAVDYPDVKEYPAANCVNGNPGSGWSSASTGFPPSCYGGSNNLNGTLQPIPSSGGTAYLDTELPGDWDTATKPYLSIYYGSGANTSGTVIWTISHACTKQDGSVTDDPAFLAESAMGTQTMVTANRMWAQSAQFSGTFTNCIAGSTMYLKIVLSGTASSAINVSKIMITVPRLLTLQAN